MSSPLSGETLTRLWYRDLLLLFSLARGFPGQGRSRGKGRRKVTIHIIYRREWEKEKRERINREQIPPQPIRCHSRLYIAKRTYLYHGMNQIQTVFRQLNNSSICKRYESKSKLNTLMGKGIWDVGKKGGGDKEKEKEKQESEEATYTKERAEQPWPKPFPAHPALRHTFVQYIAKQKRQHQNKQSYVVRTFIMGCTKSK